MCIIYIKNIFQSIINYFIAIVLIYLIILSEDSLSNSIFIIPVNTESFDLFDNIHAFFEILQHISIIF